MIFGAAIGEGLFILLNKRLGTAIPALTQSALMTAIGFVVAAVPVFFEHHDVGIGLQSAIFAVVYYALVLTVGGFLLWYAGAESASAVQRRPLSSLPP